VPRKLPPDTIGTIDRVPHTRPGGRPHSGWTPTVADRSAAVGSTPPVVRSPRRRPAGFGAVVGVLGTLGTLGAVAAVA
jgi:hypothetical protein